MLLGFVAANATLVLVAVLILSGRPASPPLIQGVFLPKANALEAFELLDHNGSRFSNANLNGSWHLVSYGFTTCPDICPTTLSQLATVAKELKARGMNDLNILFYSVDHRRDTSEKLALYMPYFHPDFLGLTHVDDPENPHLPFEKSLGIAAQLTVVEEEADPNSYQVSHGVSLLLINPHGELQAVFQPDETSPGVHSFNPDKLIADYLAIRHYLG